MYFTEDKLISLKDSFILTYSELIFHFNKHRHPIAFTDMGFIMCIYIFAILRLNETPSLLFKYI